MKAVRIHAFGGPEQLHYEEAPEPALPDNHVLIQVAAAAVNHADLSRRKGSYLGRLEGAGGQVPLPAILGLEVAGTVVRTGPAVSGFRAGDRVLAWHVSGGYAEYTTAPALSVCLLPEGLSFEQGAGMPNAFLTADHILRHCAKLQEGESVLVQAAASGVGTIAVQLAKHLGARVLATASTEEKLQRLRALGADVLINYSQVDFVSAARQATEQRGVEVVLECVGGEVLTKSLLCLAPLGRLVIYGRVSGSLPFLDTDYIATRNLTVVGAHRAMPPWKGPMQQKQDSLQALLRLVQEGKIRPVNDRSFPLAEAAAAHEYLADRRTIGKVVLIP